MKFVLDASVALLWLVPQTNPDGVPYASSVLAALKSASAIVPSLWSVEVANVTAKVEAKGLVAEAQSQFFVSQLERLDISTDPDTSTHALGETLNLARRYKLSAYDATYLELALRMGLPLATLDADLAKAAKKAGVPAFKPN